MELTQLKKEYSVLQKKYKLPDFKCLNEDFEIEKLDKDTDTLLRAIRKQMIEKIVNSIGFLDMLLNPINVPRTYLNYVKGMTAADRQIIETMYGQLAELSIDSINCEIEYDEKSEAALIQKIYSAWDKTKPQFKTIIKHIKNPSNNFIKKEKSYFG